MPQTSIACRPKDSSEDDQASYSIHLLGLFRVEYAGREITPPPGIQARTIKLLALHGGSMHREHLAELLWPGQDRCLGQTRLRNVLTRLRPRIGALLGRRGENIAFVAPYTLDTQHFLATSAEAIRQTHHDPHAALAAGRQALDAYRGHLLIEDRYDDDIEDARQRFARRLVTLLDALADAAQTSDIPHEAALYRGSASDARIDVLA